MEGRLPDGDVWRETLQSPTRRFQDPPADDERLGRFSNLLREARRRIPVDRASLGNMLRLPSRIGKPVSQEEFAEAIGVSRVWYGMLEGGRLPRVSVPLLERICDALMLDERQRADVFQLGVPEISSQFIATQHAAVLEASAQLRAVARRLWSASTVEEALVIAAEESTRHFSDAALVFFVHRIAPGRWRYPFVLDRGLGSRNGHMFEELALSLTPAGFDEIALHPALSLPGDVGTRDSFRITSVGEAYEAAAAKHRLHRSRFIHARIRSRGGVTAGITVKHASEHDYSDVERATLSAIASLTSLALP
jgi:transcriptional regulator with XRE-family HTH domain